MLEVAEVLHLVSFQTEKNKILELRQQRLSSEELYR